MVVCRHECGSPVSGAGVIMGMVVLSSGNERGSMGAVPLIVWPSSGNDHAGVSVDPDSMGVLSSGSKCGSC